MALSTERKKCWQPAIGGASIKLAEALEPAFKMYVLHQKPFYTSDDMKRGVDVEYLCEVADDVLAPLLRLDPRGGYFRHTDMDAAMRLLAEKPEYRAAFEILARKRSESEDDTLTTLAHMIRVMLSHFRPAVRSSFQ